MVKFTDRINTSFNQQRAMAHIKATIPIIEQGKVEIHLPVWDGVTQQNGFVHGGVIGMIADSAAGYAAMSVTPEDTGVLTAEYKINFISPAFGSHLIARGRVIKPGRTLILTTAEVFSVLEGEEKLCALMQQTIMVVKQ